MKQATFVLPRFSKIHNILQGTTKVSLGDFNFFHGRNQRQVRKNIKKLKHRLGYDSTPLLLVRQVHGSRIKIVRAKPKIGLSYFSGFDALITEKRGLLIGILTADCLPVFIYDRRQHVIGLIHAGWRGIARKIVPAVIKKMQKSYHSRAADIIAGIGPHISSRNYEIDVETAGKLGLKANDNIQADLAGLVREQLIQAGVPARSIETTLTCTYTSRQCYSYRRQGKKAGRLLSFLLLK
ncbi:MAG: peptidoglycan editing factor PgeF [bacterium]|nr:peptidoglycan editing factor PgeF [bacterium]